MSEETIDRLGAETGIGHGITAVREGLVLAPEVVQHLSGQALADFIRRGSDTEARAARKYAMAWHEGFARGFRHGVAALTRPPDEDGRPRGGPRRASRLQESAPEGLVIDFPRGRAAGSGR